MTTRPAGSAPPCGSSLLRSPDASAPMVECGAVAADDEEQRRVRLLLLGKAAVLAHRFERPLAAEMDEQEQSGLPLPSCMEAVATARLLLFHRRGSENSCSAHLKRGSSPSIRTPQIGLPAAQCRSRHVSASRTLGRPPLRAVSDAPALAVRRSRLTITSPPKRPIDSILKSWSSSAIHCAASSFEASLSVNVRRDAHHRGINEP
jgi:hypothetical protein